MNRKVVILLAVILLAIFGGTAFLLMDTEDQLAVKTPSRQSQTSETTPTGAGEYLAYDETKLATAREVKLLFFHAPWCPQCRDLESDIQSKPIDSDVSIFKVDYDTNQKLRQKYGVTIQTTVVRIDANGTLIKKHVAYDEPTLAAVLNQLR